MRHFIYAYFLCNVHVFKIEKDEVIKTSHYVHAFVLLSWLGYAAISGQLAPLQIVSFSILCGNIHLYM